MRLSHNGVEWSGTFGVVLRALVDDLLADGPIEATVTYLDRADREASVSVEVTGITAMHLLVSGSRPDIPLEMVLAFEI